LKRFSLKMNPICAFALLQRLELPGGIDEVDLFWVGCTLGEVRRVIGPYICDWLHGCGGSEARLFVLVDATISYTLLKVSVVGTGVQLSPPCAQFTATLSHRISEHERAELRSDVLALSPRERITHLVTELSASVAEELVTMPNIEVLHLRDAVISNRFLLSDPSGPNAHRKLLPSLRELHLEYRTTVFNSNWEPLVRYLIHQTHGEHSLTKVCVYGQGVNICPEVQGRIRSLVEQFEYV
jgi:hypothetical protein